MPVVDQTVELQEFCAYSQVIMPTADSSASKEVVTAALLVIGGKILSGRTKDQNIWLYRGISDGDRHRSQGSAGAMGKERSSMH